MSFPWKKLKKTSISQLVKDHVCSHTPLMVQTGFPTSLVHLFVKNHQRFMKTSKKKRPPSPLVAEPPLSSLSSMSLPLSSPLTPPPPGRCTIKRSRLKGCPEIGERIDLDEAVDKDKVLIALLKIFLVVVLVLGTNKLVLGITMSAFLLCFFEYSRERVYRLCMPCAGAQRSEMVEMEDEEKDCVFKAPLAQENLAKPRFSGVAKIHVLKPPHGEEVQCVMEKTDESSRGSKLKSHKFEMKSKMKRFLAKKLRRKTSKELESQVISIRENEELEDFNDCQESSEQVFDATIVKVDSSTRKVQNSASIVLLLVVLVGLTGGRTFALVFTLTWCIMSKQVLLI
ncbi:hypothetical protein P3S67_023402 [Capsicum chacoense]